MSCPSRLIVPLVGRDEPGDHVEDRRLAGPVRPEQADRLAVAHVEGGLVHHGAAAVAFLQTLDRQDAGSAEPGLDRRPALRADAERFADEAACSTRESAGSAPSVGTPRTRPFAAAPPDGCGGLAASSDTRPTLRQGLRLSAAPTG